MLSADPAGRGEVVWRLFNDIAELPLEARTARLDAACRDDPDLRHEVASLLDAHARADVVLDPYEQPLRAPLPVEEAPGTEGRSDPHRIIGRAIAHYRIDGYLGGGGMGVVYRARDTKLDRFVALKFLPPELSRDAEARERFVHEARAASALDHTNICTVYEIGETEQGQAFLAMAYYPGETLKAIIARGPLPVEEALDYAIQMAEGLARAHEAGIVHRDVKPANLIVTPGSGSGRARGRVKIVDFGLAKVADVSLTRTGTTLGTVAYMSPEQASGASVDHRTDLWSLGVVLYEMLTGTRPFPGEYPQAVIYAILNNPPVPLADHRPEMPEVVVGVVEGLLQKDPDRRYQRAEEVLADLQPDGPARPPIHRPGRRVPRRGMATAFAAAVLIAGVLLLGRFWSGGEEPSIDAIAVLPFQDLTGGGDEGYFSAGMTDALIDNLGRIEALHRVISRTSVMQYKDEPAPLPQIGEALGVPVIVEGSVGQEGDSIYVGVRLMEAATEHRLWSARFVRARREVLSMQREIALAIANEIEVELTPGERSHLAGGASVDPEAYDAYLRGRFHMYMISPGHYDVALRYFETALEIDSTYALAHVGIASVWGHYGLWGGVPPGEANARVKEAISKALALDDELAEAYMVLGLSAYGFEWDWQVAEDAFSRAVALDPNAIDVRLFYGDFLLSMGRFEEAFTQIERAVERDPLNAFSYSMLGWAHYAARQYDEALEALDRALSLRPGDAFALRCLWGARYRLGNEEDALAAAMTFFRAQNHPEVAADLEERYAQAGYAEAVRYAAERLADRAEQAYVPAMHIARLYAHAGEQEAALDLLDRAYADRFFSMSAIAVDSDWDALRDHPRFLELLRRMNLPG